MSEAGTIGQFTEEMEKMMKKMKDEKINPNRKKLKVRHRYRSRKNNFSNM